MAAPIRTALATVGHVIKSAQALEELAKKIDNADLTNAIADLTLALAEVKVQLAQALEYNLEVKADLDKSRNIADLRSKLVLDGNLYKLREPVEGFGEGPFCTRCFDADGLLINLHAKIIPGGLSGNMLTGSIKRGPPHTVYVCPQCSQKKG